MIFESPSRLVTPTGSVGERIAWAALSHVTVIGGCATWRDLETETGSNWREIKTGVNKLIARGIVTREIDRSGIELLRLRPEYRLRFCSMFRRILPEAEIVGGPKPFTVGEDVRSLVSLTEDFPVDSLLVYCSQRFPQYLNDKARERLGRVVVDYGYEEEARRPYGPAFSRHLWEGHLYK
jgi:hypothetical protein